MRRDLELVRKLLVFFDKQTVANHVDVPPIEGYDAETIKYHLVLLYNAGYLSCEPVRSSASERVIPVLPFELTWAGHEFLDKIRNEHIWNEIMTTVHDRGFVSASVDMLKKLADNAIRKRLGLT